MDASGDSKNKPGGRRQWMFLACIASRNGFFLKK